MLPENTPIGAKAFHRIYGEVTVTEMYGDAVTVTLENESLLATWRKWLTAIEGE